MKVFKLVRQFRLPLALLTSFACFLEMGCGGKGSSQSASGVATLSASNLSFGTIVVGTTSSAQTLRLTNTGTADLHLGSAAFVNSAAFQSISTCGSTLTTGASCVYTVTFTPQITGSLSTSFVITSDSGGITGTQAGVIVSGTGAAAPTGTALLSPQSLGFGNLMQGLKPAIKAVTLTNSGSGDLHLAGAAIGDTKNFTLGSTCGTTLPSGASCTFTIDFAPQATGSFGTSLVITSDSGGVTGTQAAVMISGTGTAVPTGTVTLNPQSLNFGSLTQGISSMAKTVSLTNSGNGDLHLTGTAISDTKNFSLNSTCGATLPSSASCTLTIAFTPQAVGNLSTSLVITTDSGGVAGSQAMVGITGTGTAPPTGIAVLNPVSLIFPATYEGSAATAKSITLTNNGQGDLHLGASIFTNGTNFLASTTCGMVLAAGSTCIYQVTFSPQTAGDLTSAFSLATDSGGVQGSAATVSLQGTGLARVPSASVSTDALAFAQTVTNAATVAQAVTLKNSGNDPLLLSSVTLGGANAANFTLQAGGTCGSTLAAGASCVESVAYTPKLANKADTATLVFTDNAANQAGSQQTVTLTGSSTAEVDSVMNFGDSITCGYYAQPNDGTGYVYSNSGYAGLFDTSLGVPAQNFCRAGDMSPDMVHIGVAAHAIPEIGGHQVYTVMIGTNDGYLHGVGDVELQEYTDTQRAAITWLALPDSEKVFASAMSVQAGAWSADGRQRFTTTDGAKLSFTLHQTKAGRSGYVVFHSYSLPSASSGSVMISVDGQLQGSYLTSSSLLPTQNGTTESYTAQAITLGEVGDHTVTLQTSLPPGAQAEITWAGVAQEQMIEVDGSPRVLVGNVPDSPSGNQSYISYRYSLAVESLLQALQADGLNVTVVLAREALDAGTDFADILHPNTAGHAKLASVFKAAR